jgi:hypothetical protein
MVLAWMAKCHQVGRMPDEHYHADLIATLGGKHKLAAALGLPPSGLAKWPTRGIPAKYWPYIVQLTQAEISLIDLAKTKPTKRAYVPPPVPIAAEPEKPPTRARKKPTARKRPKATKKPKKTKARQSSA